MALTKHDLQQIQSIVRIEVEEIVDTKLTELRNDFYNKIDPFLIEIQEARQDREVLSAKVYEHDEVLEQLKHIHKSELKLAI